jgi:uncharacterized membrane protein (DUF4010 family)
MEDAVNGDLAGLFVAALGGACVGVERQHSGHASGDNARFGGVRTFTLLGGLSGIAGYLSRTGPIGLAVTLTAAACALIIAAYAAASRRDIDATTEAAALVVVSAGLLAGRDQLALASGIIALTTLLLTEKSYLHTLVDGINDDEMKAAVRFGVMAVVILPLLPEGPFGPLGGFRPRLLWTLVLLFTGLTFLGYLAGRVTRGTSGYRVAGLLGGLLSSTAVTLSFSRLSRTEPASSRALALGTVAASMMLFPRIIVALMFLNTRVALELLMYLALPFAASLVALLLVRLPVETAATVRTPANPLQFVPALQMAVAFQCVLFATTWVRTAFGNVGLVASGAFLGLTDVDALTVSMAQAEHYGASAVVAARAIAVGVAANSWIKLIIAVTIGTPDYRRVAGVWLGVIAVVATLAAFVR